MIFFDVIENLIIIINKHSVARTAVEQDTDLCPVFRTLKSLIQYTTRDDFPSFVLVDKSNKVFLNLKHKGIFLAKSQ